MRKHIHLSAGRVLLLVTAAFALGPARAAASVSNDQVQSQHIREADGTTGQNTNTGNGVKTGHIQDGAVTDSKIAGPISGSKLGAHSHVESDVTGLSSTLATKADASHAHDDVYQRKYANVVVVAKGGGDFGDLAVALDAITDASATNRYLVKVMPGVYDIGETTLYLRPYVDIEGSGRALTVVRGSLRGSGGATVYMVSETELRSLSVESHALGEACQETASVFAIRTYGNPRIVDVAARAYGSAAPAAVVVHDNATPTLINVDLRAEAAPGDVCLTTAQGIAVYTGSVTVDGATVLAVGGSSQYAVVVTSQGTAELTNVYARGATAALSSTGTTRARNCTFEGESAMSWGDIPVRAAGTRLIGQTVGLTPLKCVGCFDADFNPVP